MQNTPNLKYRLSQITLYIQYEMIHIYYGLKSTSDWYYFILKTMSLIIINQVFYDI